MPEPANAPARLWRRAGLFLAGIAAGAVTGLAEPVFLLGAGLAYAAASPSARARRSVHAAALRGARRLTALERRRLHAFFADPGDPRDEPGDARRPFAYLAARSVAGLAGAVVLVLLGTGGVLAGMLVGQLAAGRFDSGYVFLLGEALLGLVLLFLNVTGIIGIAAVERRIAVRLLGPTAAELLARRVGELEAGRAAVIAAVDDERRRIERDLHDGVQQRLVALGMLLGRARRSGDPERAADLLRQAHEETADVLRDLRDVSWRVFPTALDEAGLPTALEAVVERCGVPVDLTCRLSGRLGPELETAAYFVVCEAVNNAAKHSGADRVAVDVVRQDDRLTVVVADAGRGGADPAGGGLSGLESRVAAVDGEFRVDSPPGGPTVVRAELPCG